MLTSPDFKELLKLFDEFNVRYLVVGGYAVMYYAEPRFTKDLDVLVSVDSKNSEAVFAALAKFGAPLKGLAPKDFAVREYVYQMGMPPMRVDILMSIDGIDFEQAWTRRNEVAIQDLRMDLISREDLLVSKRAAGRPQDLLDVEAIESASDKQ